MGVSNNDPILHVCSGRIKDYPYKGLGPNDKTLDLDESLAPDFLQDAREPFPKNVYEEKVHGFPIRSFDPWAAVMIDRPYTEEDAKKYAPGPDKLPSANLLVKNGIEVVPIGGKVGILDYVWPQPPKNAKEVAVVTVATGRNNRARLFTVFERLS